MVRVLLVVQKDQALQGLRLGLSSLTLHFVPLQHLRPSGAVMLQRRGLDLHGQGIRPDTVALVISESGVLEGPLFTIVKVVAAGQGHVGGKPHAYGDVLAFPARSGRRATRPWESSI